jgi:hypothetical protein
LRWDNNNAVLAYPVAPPAEFENKAISLSSSHIISKEASASEICDWVFRLWRKKQELYGPDNVGSTIALNVKSLFYVVDVKRTFSKVKFVRLVVVLTTYNLTQK